MANADKQAKEDIKKSKPKLAQAAAAKYLKYILIAALACGVGYKFFFSEKTVDEKVAKKKNAILKNNKANQQEQMSKGKISKEKQGKDNKPAGKEEIDKIVSLDEQKISNKDIINRVSVPKLTLPETPKLEVVQIKQVQPTQQNATQSSATQQVQNSSNIPQQVSIINNINANSDNSNKSSVDNATSKKTNESNIPSMPGSPLSKSGSNKKDKTTEKVPTKKAKNGNKPGSAGSSALNSMFVLKGSGTKSTKNRGSSGQTTNDFIVFDNSSISIKETKSDMTSGSSITKMSNLENTIAVGKVIEGVLETAINSEAAGTIRAVIAKDVLGERGNKILIPRGSRVYGSYSTTSSATQTRLLLVWNKIIRPDGVVIAMSADTYDQAGQKGIEGAIDTRYGELFRNSLMYSFITLGTAIALEKVANIKGTSQILSANGTVATTNVSPANMAAQSVIDTASDIASKMTDGLTDDLNPIISIAQGTLLQIRPTKDIVIPVAYKRRTQDLQL